MLKFSVLASGSSGNCIFLKDEKNSILFDMGINYPELKYRLSQLHLNFLNLSGVFISHEHSDHVSGVKSLQKKMAAPIYISKPCYEEYRHRYGQLKLPHFYKLNDEVKVGNFRVIPVENSHDAVCTASFLIEHGSKRIGILTDTGCITKRISENFQKMDAFLLEFNHDVDMLINGHYPESLKQRIFSNRGHLSNIQAAQFVKENLDSRLKHLFLGHMSEHNNTHEKAVKAVEKIIKSEKEFEKLSPILTYHEKPTKVLEL